MSEWISDPPSPQNGKQASPRLAATLPHMVRLWLAYLMRHGHFWLAWYFQTRRPGKHPLKYIHANSDVNSKEFLTRREEKRTEHWAATRPKKKHNKSVRVRHTDDSLCSCSSPKCFIVFLWHHLNRLTGEAVVAWQLRISEVIDFHRAIGRSF